MPMQEEKPNSVAESVRQRLNQSRQQLTADREQLLSILARLKTTGDAIERAKRAYVETIELLRRIPKV